MNKSILSILMVLFLIGPPATLSNSEEAMTEANSKTGSIATPSSVQKLSAFALNQAAQNARLKMFTDPSAENLATWSEAITKDPAIRQKLRSGRVSREALEEIRLLLRGANLIKISGDEGLPFNDLVIRLIQSQGDEFSSKLADSVLNDPAVPLSNKVFFSLRAAGSYRFLRDWVRTDNLLKKTTALILTQMKNGPDAKLILPTIRWITEAGPIARDPRWLFFYSSIYLAVQRIAGPEENVPLKDFYLRHLQTLVFLGLWEDTKRFGDFLSKQIEIQKDLPASQEVFESVFYSKVFLRDRTALSYVDQYIELASGRPGWKPEDAAKIQVRKAFGYLYLGELELAKELVDKLSKESNSDPAFKLNLLKTRCNLNTYLEKWTEALADAKSIILLEQPLPSSFAGSYWDIRSIFLTEKISPGLVKGQADRFVQNFRSIPRSSEIFWSIHPLAELAHIFYQTKDPASLNLLIKYTDAQFKHTALDKFVPFFQAWKTLQDISSLPKNRRDREKKKLEELNKKFERFEPVLAKLFSDSLKEEKNEDKKKIGP